MRRNIDQEVAIILTNVTLRPLPCTVATGSGAKQNHRKRGWVSLSLTPVSDTAFRLIYAEHRG